MGPYYAVSRCDRHALSGYGQPLPLGGWVDQMAYRPTVEVTTMVSYGRQRRLSLFGKVRSRYRTTTRKPYAFGDWSYWIDCID